MQHQEIGEALLLEIGTVILAYQPAALPIRLMKREATHKLMI